MKGEKPQLRGFADIGGLKIELSAWIKLDKNGHKFISAPLGRLGNIMLFENLPKECIKPKDLKL